MVRGFSTKKIKSKKTLGEFLKSERIKKDISLSDAEIGTKVRAKYLVAIEQDKWDGLPDSVYLRGFVLAYAKFLNLDKDEVLSAFENELKIRQTNTQSDLSYTSRIENKRVLVTPKILVYASISLFVCFMCSYIVFQVLNFAGNPNLKIITPDNNIILETDTLNLIGLTDVDAAVAVNNETVPVSDEGKFYLNLKLHKGVNVIKINAINKARKESSEVYTVEYKPKTAAAGLNTNE